MHAQSTEGHVMLITSSRNSDAVIIGWQIEWQLYTNASIDGAYLIC